MFSWNLKPWNQNEVHHSVVWLFALKSFDQLDCGAQGRIPSCFKGVAGQVHMLNMPKRGALLEAVIARLQASLGFLLSDFDRCGTIKLQSLH